MLRPFLFYKALILWQSSFTSFYSIYPFQPVFVFLSVLYSTLFHLPPLKISCRRALDWSCLPDFGTFSAGFLVLPSRFLVLALKSLVLPSRLPWSCVPCRLLGPVFRISWSCLPRFLTLRYTVVLGLAFQNSLSFLPDSLVLPFFLLVLAPITGLTFFRFWQGGYSSYFTVFAVPGSRRSCRLILKILSETLLIIPCSVIGHPSLDTPHWMQENSPPRYTCQRCLSECFSGS